MAFVVEDGTGLTNANAYLSVADFKSYHDDRGQDYSSFSDTQIEQAIVRSTDYIDRRFKGSFVGYRWKVNQSLEWPRTSAFYPDGRAATGVPTEVRQATAEYAFRSLSESLAPDPVYNENNMIITSKEEQVGPIREKYGTDRGYAGGSIATFRKYPMADSLLKELVTQGSYLQRV